MTNRETKTASELLSVFIRAKVKEVVGKFKPDDDS